MKNLIYCLAFLAPGAWAASEIGSSVTERPALVLSQGEQRLLRVPGLSRFSLGSDAIRGRSQGGPRGESLLIKAIHPGMSDVWVWKSDGSSEHRIVRIEKLPIDEISPPLAQALSRLAEAEVLYSGNGVILRGLITQPGELARIAALAEGYKQVLDETETADPLLDQGYARIESWLRTSGFSEKLRLERQAGALKVGGSLEKPVDQFLVARKIRAIFPKAILELQALPDSSPTVHFRVYLLELKRNRFASLGIGWPGAQEGAFRVSPAGIQNRLDLDLALQALEGDGSAKILSAPELVVRVPGEAELFSGGEIPIKTQNKFFTSIAWKNFGLTLQLKVSHTTGAKVRLEIFAEVSHLDLAIGNEHTPGIQANRMKTQVDARYGYPLLLSGLLQQGTREQAKGLPFFRDIPVLGKLFGSEDYLSERSELVAILLPSFTPPAAPIERVESVAPRGPMPAPRNWITPSRERALRQSSEFPWNALE